MTRSPVEARFWFAPGVLVFEGQKVSYPPPRDYVVMVKEPMQICWTEKPYSPEDCVMPQRAIFRLTNFHASHHIAHYDLESTPPDGWKWMAVRETIHAERSTR